ncbi:DHBP synthase RibB-like alpha/beta domain-containing protein [Lipomyces arxii]|uniref:DHBP synthase RibB-like alpha/beta domain-containing protein n=1 Tax=Lipomyces arxii TaxID=56418 RepID=UPI0034CD6A06
MFATIPEALEAFKKGEFLVVLDDESRENEGDLIIAAELVTTEQMAFLVRHSSGFVCAPLTLARADELDLQPMIAHNSDRHGTAYTVTVDVREGTTTGISAHDRALTCRALANSVVEADGFMRPGHVVPLRAVDGGVLKRRGHTEAAVDLCKWSGLAPAGVICEIVRDEDGLMARRDDCLEFGKKHGILVITIDALADYITLQQS